ncbi:MAG: hypothetical protein D3909_13715, partial [Candidatus Electrothrix sp. ATG1]|nr:hypothetical protein [Candidatus Electrothrix sp. ATG1]
MRIVCFLEKDIIAIIFEGCMKIFNLFLFGVFFCAAVSFAGECTEQFSWVPNTEQDLAGYKIYYGLDEAEPYPNALDIGKPPAAADGRIYGTVSGLECGTTYYFVCRAYNEAGLESDPTDPVAVIAGGESLPPSPSLPPSEGEVTATFGSVPEANYNGTIQDTFINLNTENNVTSQQLHTYTWPDNTVANAILMKIDLSQLPKGAQVQSASLQLYATNAGGDSDYDISIHKIIHHNPNLSTATGLTYDGT